MVVPLFRAIDVLQHPHASVYEWRCGLVSRRYLQLVMIAIAVITSCSCTSVEQALPSGPPRSGASEAAPSPLRSGPTPPQGLSASPSGVPSDSPPRGTLVFGSSRQVAFPGDPQSDIFVFADTIVWSAAPWQTNVPPLRPGAGSIHELTVATGEARILYTATSAKAAVTVKASADWLTWLETTDTFGLSDARLLAMPRGGGTPVVIDDMRRYSARASFPMWCIDGADVYWTVPELRAGKATADLHHKHLPDGPTEVLVAAQPGQIPKGRAGTRRRRSRSLSPWSVHTTS